MGFFVRVFFLGDRSEQFSGRHLYLIESRPFRYFFPSPTDTNTRDNLGRVFQLVSGDTFCKAWLSWNLPEKTSGVLHVCGKVPVFLSPKCL